MRLLEFIEGKLTEQAAPAFNLGGLNPQQFQQRYGISSQQAANAFNNIRALNPAYNTPRFSSALNQFLLDNPKAMQAANENSGPRNAPRVNPGSLARGVAGRLLGAIGLILTPSAANQGEDLQLAQMQQMQEFEDYLLRSDPLAYKQLMDTYAANMSDQEREGGFDPRQSDEYRAAEEAARILQRQSGAPVAQIQPTAPQIEPDAPDQPSPQPSVEPYTPTQPDAPEPQPSNDPIRRPAETPIELPDTPEPLVVPDRENVPREMPAPGAPQVEPDAPAQPVEPEPSPSDTPLPGGEPTTSPIVRPTLPAPITPTLPNVDVAAPPAPATSTAGGPGRPPTGRTRRRDDAGERDKTQYAPMKFTPIQIADPLKLRRYQEFK